MQNTKNLIERQNRAGRRSIVDKMQLLRRSTPNDLARRSLFSFNS